MIIKRIILLNKSEDEEIEDKEMNDAELADIFAGWFLLNKSFLDNRFDFYRKRFI